MLTMLFSRWGLINQQRPKTVIHHRTNNNNNSQALLELRATMQEDICLRVARCQVDLQAIHNSLQAMSPSLSLSFSLECLQNLSNVITRNYQFQKNSKTMENSALNSPSTTRLWPIRAPFALNSSYRQKISPISSFHAATHFANFA